MQTFKSTVRLTPTFHFENREAAKNYLTHALVIIAVFTLVLFHSLGIIPKRHTPEHTELSGWVWLAMLAAAISVTVFTPLYYRLYPRLRHTRNNDHRRRCKRLYGTSEPTLETCLEDDTVLVRVVETGREERFPLKNATVDQTDNYIIIRTGRSRIAPFSKSDFSEEELTSLLEALKASGCEIMPNS